MSTRFLCAGLDWVGAQLGERRARAAGNRWSLAGLADSRGIISAACGGHSKAGGAVVADLSSATSKILACFATGSAMDLENKLAEQERRALLLLRQAWSSTPWPWEADVEAGGSVRSGSILCAPPELDSAGDGCVL